MDWRLATAAGILVLHGLSFGIPCLIGIRSVAAGEGVPLVMGFPSYGGGPFERAGIKTTVPLLVAFLVVCVAELALAPFVLRASRIAAIASFVLIVPEMVFAWGFALPVPPVFALARSLLLASAWGELV